MSNKNRFQGFTLLEILIALFVFTLLSLMLVGALHSVITAASQTEKNAERLRSVQLVLLMMSRDIEQAVDRSVLNTQGGLEPAFIGSPEHFSLTHLGYASESSAFLHSSLQRSGYEWHDHILWRKTWDVLDEAPQSQPHSRQLLSDVDKISFEYLDHNNHFHHDWPVAAQKESLPKAIKINLTLSTWGKLSQLYVISAEPTQSHTSIPQS